MSDETKTSLRVLAFDEAEWAANASEHGLPLNCYGEISGGDRYMDLVEPETLAGLHLQKDTRMGCIKCQLPIRPNVFERLLILRKVAPYCNPITKEMPAVDRRELSPRFKGERRRGLRPSVEVLLGTRDITIASERRRIAVAYLKESIAFESSRLFSLMRDDSRYGDGQLLEKVQSWGALAWDFERSPHRARLESEEEIWGFARFLNSLNKAFAYIHFQPEPELIAFTPSPELATYIKARGYLSPEVRARKSKARQKYSEGFGKYRGLPPSELRALRGGLGMHVLFERAAKWMEETGKVAPIHGTEQEFWAFMGEMGKVTGSTQSIHREIATAQRVSTLPTPPCNNSKFEFTGRQRTVRKTVVFQIKSKGFPGADKGHFGGWLQSEANLSAEGNCWVADDAVVMGDARVTEDARVENHAKVFNKAIVRGRAKVFGRALVFHGAVVQDDAQVSEHARVEEFAKVTDRAQVRGKAVLYWKAHARGAVVIADGHHDELP